MAIEDTNKHVVFFQSLNWLLFAYILLQKQHKTWYSQHFFYSNGVLVLWCILDYFLMEIITASLDTKVCRDTLCWQGKNSWRWVWTSIYQLIITPSSSSVCCKILIMFLYSKVTKDVPQTEWTQIVRDISRMQKSMGNLIMTSHFKGTQEKKVL